MFVDDGLHEEVVPMLDDHPTYCYNVNPASDERIGRRQGQKRRADRGWADRCRRRKNNQAIND